MSGPRRWSRLWPVAILIPLLILAELAQHVLLLGSSVSAIILLLGLVPIALAGLRAGLPMAIAVNALFSAYVLHYRGSHAEIVSLTGESLRTVGLVFLLGLGMAFPMNVVRKRESRLRTAVDERTRDLEKRNKELAESNAALEAFGYVVSHDLKEPVRALENYLHAALEEWPRPESREDVEEAYRANQRLARMLQGLLEFSRVSSAIAEPRAVDVGEALRSDACRTRYETIAKERAATIDIAPDLPTVWGDERVLCQLFGNLVLNAVRHNPRLEPRVKVRALHATGGRAHIVVEDDGPGFPPEVLARFRGDAPAGPTTIRGGFGLIITQRAAQRLRGKLWLENRSDGGAAHVELRAGAPATSEASMPPAVAAGVWTGRRNSRGSSGPPT